VALECSLSVIEPDPVARNVVDDDQHPFRKRDLMGATDPKKAEKGTIRADFAYSIDATAVRGSDSIGNAAVEIAYFFASPELCLR